ncbi:MAG: hypothetical protein ACLRSW_07390 [Christensenellaceae bacterium]
MVYLFGSLLFKDEKYGFVFALLFAVASRHDGGAPGRMRCSPASSSQAPISYRFSRGFRPSIVRAD